MEKDEPFYSDCVKMFNSKLNVENRIIMVTPKLIFVFDNHKLAKFTIDSLGDLETLSLVKSNPSLVQLTFNNETKSQLLIQTYHRTQLVVFLITQRENLGKKTNLVRTETLY